MCRLNAKFDIQFISRFKNTQIIRKLTTFQIIRKLKNEIISHLSML